MAYSEICPICKRKTTLTKHHIKKWKVFHCDDVDNIIYICARCHNTGKDCLEELVRERENDILRLYPDMYEQALIDYMNGVRPKKRKYRKKK